MNKYISCICAILLSVTGKAQTGLPGQCQAGMPKILNSELIKEKEIKQFLGTSDWGQSQKVDKYWVVYSDRENNITYNKPNKSSGRFSSLNFNEELHIAKLRNSIFSFKREKSIDEAIS